MTDAISTVQEYMTTIPYSVGFDQKLSVAHDLMRAHRIRHLPVLSGGKLVGLLTDRDLHLIETLKGVDPNKVSVEEAMTQMPYTVPPEAPLDEVCAEMAANKYGCAVIVRNNKVIGVLTTVDVCRALANFLRNRHPRG